MDPEAFSCAICLDTADEAVETSCCHQLFCAQCIGQVESCPMCRKSFTTTPNHPIRRIIGSMIVPCKFCNDPVQRSEIIDHQEMCPEKLFPCPHGCSYEGKKDDVLNHLITIHAKELLVPQQTTKDDGVDNRVAGTHNSKDRMARLGSTGKFYCGDQINHGSCKGCDGYCGPDDGCNCVPCMRLDLEKRKLPHGYLVNADGFPSTAMMAPDHALYCGRKVIQDRRTDGYCGPTNGPNCEACAMLGKDIPFYKDIILSAKGCSPTKGYCGLCTRLVSMLP